MTRKLNKTLFAVALVTAGSSSVALAEIAPATPTVHKVFTASSTGDLARVIGTGANAKLRATDEEFTNEQMTFAFGAGNKGIAIEMHSAEALNPATNTVTLPPGPRANNRMQGACAPIELVNNAGVTEAKPTGQPVFITANNGNEYRQFNHPRVMPINDGKNFAVFYNVQFQGTNDTVRLVAVLDATCKHVPMSGGQAGQPNRYNAATNPGVIIMAKNNDDACMMQDTAGETALPLGGGKTKFVSWCGANGNGRDDGWAFRFNLNCQLDANGAATACAAVKGAGDDVSVEANEERTHGSCTVGTDKNTATCTWTAGNTQPQREGAWIGAVDITDGQPMKVLWKKMVAGRKEVQVAGKAVRTYAMRAMHTRVLNADGSPSDVVMFRSGDVQGSNANNGIKGGVYRANEVSLLKATRAGLEIIQAPTNFKGKFLGALDTHVTMCAGVFGTTSTPGFAMMSGSMTATGDASIRFLTTDGAKLKHEPQTLSVGANYDMHLYSNLLGNNPYNQGRGFGDCQVMKDPFNPGKSILIAAVNGKDVTQGASQFKPSGYLSTLVVAGPKAPAAGSGTGQSGNGEGNTATDGDSSVGGCSTGSGSTGLATLFLLGLVAAIRRRRA